MRTKESSSLAAYALLAGILIGCIFSGSVKAADPGISLRVLWTVSGYVLGNAATMTEQEAKGLLFKPLDMNETGINFNNRVCKWVTFQRETVDAAQYLADVWQVTPRTLGIDGQKLQVIRTNCDIPGFQEYMRLSDRRLIVPIKGVFFFFEPAVTY